jgi:hypothetical protein
LARLFTYINKLKNAVGLKKIIQIPYQVFFEGYYEDIFFQGKYESLAYIRVKILS